MFIYTVKWQNIKFGISLIVAASAVALTATLFPRDSTVSLADSGEAVQVISDKDLKNINSNEERLGILSKYAYQVESEPCKIEEIVIPEKFDAVYSKYNELQIESGFDLSKYKGKSVKKYSYRLLPSGDEGTVYVNLLIYKGRLIGGDISSASADGFQKALLPFLKER